MDKLKGYPWPASFLSSKEMAKLAELRARTGRPITKLLQESVTVYYRLFSLPEDLISDVFRSLENAEASQD